MSVSEPISDASKPDAPDQDYFLSVRNICKVYKSPDRPPLQVLDGVHFDAQKGEVIAIVGESGTGKSTLLHLLGVLDRPSAGQILYQGQDVFKKSDEELAHFRNRSIGFIFQFHHLLPEFTAVENVAMPALIQNQKLSEVRPRAMELLRSMGLEDRAQHRPSELSGGEQQRVAVARALMNKPALVLADEPTGNLDQRTADSLHNDIMAYSRSENQTFILVTHNPTLAERADRVLKLENGQLHAL